MFSDFYDPTAGEVITPQGVGKYVMYNNLRKTVIVEIEHRYLVSYPADQVYIKNPEKRL